MQRRHFLQSSSAAIALSLHSAPAKATSPTTIYFPFSPGASGDTNIRLITKEVIKTTGQSFIIDNKPGANGIIGAEIVKRANPDGKSLYIANVGSHAINASIYKNKLPYNIDKDFSPITLLWQFPCVLAVNAKNPAKNFDEFVQQHKKSPEGLSFASAGNGSGGHLLAELWSRAIQRPFVHVPYKGAAPAVQDLLAGRVDAFFVSYSSIKPHVESGQLKVLVVAGNQRLQALPQIPTLVEKGWPSVHMNNWFGLVAPAGTPTDVVNDLAKHFAQAVAQPSIYQRLASDGIEAVSNTPAEFKNFINSEVQRYATLIASLNIKED